MTTSAQRALGFALSLDGSSGLTFGLESGIIFAGGVGRKIGPQTVSLAASATNFVEVNFAGVVTANTTAFTADRDFLYVVTTTARGIATVQDWRANPTVGQPSTQSTSASGGIGYATGAGGTAIQITSRATGVTMSPNPCMSGTITTDTSALLAETAADFIVTNSAVAIGDTVLVSQRSGGNGGNTAVTVVGMAAGTFTLRLSNNNAAAGTSETGALIINFAVIKAVSA